MLTSPRISGRRSLILAVLTLAPIVHHASPCRAAEPIGEARVYKMVGGRELKLFVQKPADWNAGDKRPAIVFFHGGGWVGGNATQFDEASRFLAERGMVCLQVTYRLLDKNGKEPPLVCIEDAKSAMRWVRGHAGELGVDPERIAAGGGSAGGHLAAFVGMVEGLDDPQDDRTISPKANALVLFNPVLDNGPDEGWGTQRVGDRFREFSPAHNVTKDDPPAIVFLGTKDALIPKAVMERFQANMDKAGVRCEVIYVEGQGHGFFNKEPWKTRTLGDVAKFLDSLGWLTASKPG